MTKFDLRRAYKKFRNKMAEFDASELMNFCHAGLKIADSSVDVAGIREAPPWILLLFKKWILLFGDWSGRGNRVQPRDFQYVYGKLVDCYSAVLPPRNKQELFLFMRRSLGQQIPFQRPIFTYQLARQNILFGGLFEDDKLRTGFEDFFQINIQDFIELELVMLAKFFDRQDSHIVDDWFSPLKNSYAPNIMDRFLEIFSANLAALKKFLKTEYDKHTPIMRHELFEMSPLRRFPLLREGAGCHCYSKRLLYISLSNFIYDSLRSLPDKGRIMSLWGNQFENYVNKAISYSGLDYIAEAALKKELGPNTKVVDFIISDSNYLVLVESKGVEMHYIAQVGFESEDILAYLKSSIIDGIEQGYSTIKNLHALKGNEGSGLEAPDKVFLVLVTYKELYIGNGNNLYNYIGKDELDRIVRDYGNRRWIPFEHIFVMCIDDFELTLNCVIKGQVRLSQCLEIAAKSDSGVEIAELSFHRHLKKQKLVLDMPRYLREEFLEIRGRIRPKFRT